MTTLRQRIRSDGIKATPIKRYRAEIERLPISSKCLFKKTGVPWDVLEKTLKDEGWLAKSECIWEVLSVPANLRREIYGSSYVAVDLNVEEWDQEDFEYFWEDVDRLTIHTK